MLMSKNVNNDVSNDSPIRKRIFNFFLFNQAVCMRYKLLLSTAFLALTENLRYLELRSG